MIKKDWQQETFLAQSNKPCVDGSSGSRANMTGKYAEDVVFCILKERGYTVERQKEIGLGIYNTPIRVDFYCSDIPNFPDGLIVENKWQASSGSADEKYPYLVMNIRERHPCPTIVVVDGGGMRPSALDWLKKQADGQTLIHVFSIQEFIAWSMDNLP